MTLFGKSMAGLSACLLAWAVASVLSEHMQSLPSGCRQWLELIACLASIAIH